MNRRADGVEGPDRASHRLVGTAGRWIAWSPDGARIVAEADDPESLDRLVLDAGEDPERCITEGIPAEDAFIGGVAFGTERG